MHFGISNQDCWNDDIAFGFGPSFAMLDFVDSIDLEIGIAVNATIFRGLSMQGTAAICRRSVIIIISG